MQLLEPARAVVDEGGAAVVVLAGAPLAGLAHDLGRYIPVLVVAGISAESDRRRSW